ncbi:hypothetical protein [Streptomyces sp. NPDC058252]|uniref:hypothetical protein n=1 Tax=Streptomyces sp. NPDC058252 TaxID=3346405 RepID=UPI0036E27CD9
MDIKVLELDEAGNPEFITVRMTVLEAAFMAEVTGKQSSNDAEQVFAGGSAPSHSIYDALVGSVFNRFWDGGVDDYLRGQA